MRVSTALAGATLSVLIGTTACSSTNNATPNSQTTVSPTSADASAAQITKSEFLARAKQICHKDNLEIRQVPHGGDPASHSAGEQAIVRILQGEIAQLRSLGYPPGDRGTLEPIYNGALGALASRGPRAIAVPWGQELTAYGLDCGN